MNRWLVGGATFAGTALVTEVILTIGLLADPGDPSALSGPEVLVQAPFVALVYGGILYGAGVLAVSMVCAVTAGRVPSWALVCLVSGCGCVAVVVSPDVSPEPIDLALLQFLLPPLCWGPVALAVGRRLAPASGASRPRRRSSSDRPAPLGGRAVRGHGSRGQFARRHADRVPRN